MHYLYVSLGAALGGAARYWLSNFVYRVLPATFPYGTLLVNVLGSFLLGLLVFFIFERSTLSSEWRMLLTVGFCGGFTTFSTFSLETVNLLRNTEYLMATFNIAANVILTIGAVLLAFFLSQR